MLLLLFRNSGVAVDGVGAAAGTSTVSGVSSFTFSSAFAATLNDLTALSSATLNDVTAPSSATLNDVTAPSSTTLFDAS